MSSYSLDFPFAWGGPKQTAGFRFDAEDFIVDELMLQPLSGEGEHLWLHIQKRGENTEWVAKKLAEFFSVKKMDVGYGGKKDRHAVTSQWFSIYMPGKSHDFDWNEFIKVSALDAKLLACSSHNKKLRMGEHDANKFVIRLRKLELNHGLEQQLQAIAQHGVPNYFGEQRFGRGGANLERVEEWVKDPRALRNRNTRSILMSSARSYLFNKVLGDRVLSGDWQSMLNGDPEELASGPLWGRGRSLAADECLAQEVSALEEFELWRLALENVGLNQQRRDLVLQPSNFKWQVDGADLILTLALRPGQFATAVLRELAILEQPERGQG
ncbi:tRNA pseudouridine(13) synthase TruD [Agaribacterium sp. ZY112]|uniref:tRNA pseudouridine(13) synthase TruD n=1 Tax=Agaribacterium sp. ZY112 TaxID=3233574 RepID=UPI0035246E75